ncbi:hypothetical protein [Methylocapsa sp. S129]|uniref:hypothetical protein n=1 Tax=Methylocapsa sp. S129 TaxID=1641869 RepID=UPI00131E1CF4|nr:hypothetical protein [Methylocapsa sp. S129]
MIAAMLSGRFSFGDPDANRPRRKDAGFARWILLAVVALLAILSAALRPEWFTR